MFTALRRHNCLKPLTSVIAMCEASELNMLSWLRAVSALIGNRIINGISSFMLLNGLIIG